MELLTKYLKENKGPLTIVGPLYIGEADFKEPVLFIDGGSRFRNSPEGLSLGDNDSSIGELDILLSPDKDFSDLSYALRNIPSHYKEIHLQGFLGGRKDHEIINMGEVQNFLKLAPENTCKN